MLVKKRNFIIAFANTLSIADFNVIKRELLMFFSSSLCFLIFVEIMSEFHEK